MVHSIELPDWAVVRGRIHNDFPALDGARTALVAIDMQTVFMEPGEVFGNPQALDIADKVNRAAHVVRAAGGKVYWTRQTTSAEPPLAMPAWQYDMTDTTVRTAVEVMRAGTPSHAIHPAMDVRDGDPVVDKYRYSAFMCPAQGLKSALEGTGIDTLVIAGTLTNCCCESTARDANMMGYKVVFLSDATATVTDEEHNAALLNVCIMFADVRRTDELEGLFEAARKAGAAV
ncbi:cysteine hydrolase family protein [Novosphingobium sp. BL-52-GroH]|uniref:cysteine hydrolase family protein n=1 Tax=Novosphingobium sp. BL-52-GroH TaxID=3349877 RepID=UPI00384BCF0F